VKRTYSTQYTKYILLYLSFALLIMPIRLLGVFNTAYIVLPISMVVSFLIATRFFYTNRGRGLNYVEWFICLFPLFLVPIGIANGHLLNYVFTDTLKPILWVGIIGFFKKVDIDDNFYMKEINNSVLTLAFCSFVTIVFVNYLIFTVGGIRASASDVVMLFSFFYYVINKKYLFILLFLSLLIMGGKVGPILSVLFVLLLSFLVKVKPKSIIVGFVFCLIVLFITFSYDYEQLRNYFPILSKFRILFDSSVSITDFVLIDKYLLGGRLAEIIGSMQVYSDDLFLLFTGPGVGYTYDLYRGGVLEQVNRHGVHFSPVSILTIYGAFYTFIFYGYLFYVFIKSLRILKNSQFRFKKLAAMFYIANLINSLTTYAIFSILLFPLTIGLILNSNTQAKERT